MRVLISFVLLFSLLITSSCAVEKSQIKNDKTDYPSLINEWVTLKQPAWQKSGFSEEELNDSFDQMVNMSLIAVNELKKNPEITSTLTKKHISYTPDKAKMVLELFFNMMNDVLVKAEQKGIIKDKKWMVLQNVAYHAFDYSKLAIIEYPSGDLTPEYKALLARRIEEALNYYEREDVIKYYQKAEAKSSEQQDKMGFKQR